VNPLEHLFFQLEPFFLLQPSHPHLTLGGVMVLSSPLQLGHPHVEQLDDEGTSGDIGSGLELVVLVLQHVCQFVGHLCVL